MHRARAVAPGSGLLVNRIPDLNEVATRLAKLAPSDLQRLYSDLARAGRSPKSIRNYHSCIHAMLEKAVRLGLLVRNVATMVDLPRRAYRGLPMVTLQQARAFLQVAGKHRLEALFVLAITTGARQGELLGLTWDRANLGKAITVGCPE